jgi:hypothetical protein
MAIPVNNINAAARVPAFFMYFKLLIMLRIAIL